MPINITLTSDETDMLLCSLYLPDSVRAKITDKIVED